MITFQVSKHGKGRNVLLIFVIQVFSRSMKAYWMFTCMLFEEYVQFYCHFCYEKINILFLKF